MKTIVLDDSNRVDFKNNVDSCVGTGRLGLALTQEYLEELEFVQKEIGFDFIRGHGLFSDDVSIYHEYLEDGQTKVEYNYTYIDRIVDKYLELGIKPYLELGFMPEKMARGTQTIFYWKGNTTPPINYSMWTDMVVALLKHLRSRYGEDVLEWPIEVWNEPNLPGFWEHADMQEYFKLFKKTFLAIKAYEPKFKVGGPAVCGVKEEVWIRSFLEFCIENGLQPDYITRHHYTVEMPNRVGHYDYHKLEDSKMRIENLRKTQELVDSFEEFRGTPIHITEFNTSYTPRGVIHDTNLNAAYLAGQLAYLGDVSDLYSYWTFGDVFEEEGVPFSLFHGGFGMVAAGCIPKPTFWTFAFFKELKRAGDNCIWRDDNSVVIKRGDKYVGILWNSSADTKELTLEFPCAESEYTLITKTVDEETCNPLKIWHDLGEPAYPSKEEVKLIKSSAYPLITTEIKTASAESVAADFSLKKNGVVFFELKPRTQISDRGYHYERL